MKLSKVAALLDELDGKGTPDAVRYGDGYHKRTYNCVSDESFCQSLIDELVRKIEKVNVSTHSLEMQMWWRDYLNMNAMKKAENARMSKLEEQKAAALSKLTPEELKLLKLEK